MSGCTFQNLRFSWAFRSRDFGCFKRNISKSKISCSAWRSYGTCEILMKSSSGLECNCDEEHGRRDIPDRGVANISLANAFKTYGGGCGDYREIFQSLRILQEAVCRGGDSGSGHGGRHWGSSGGNNGDDRGDWFCRLVNDAQAHLLFLFGLVLTHMRMPGIKALIPALVLHLFLHKGLIANADGITTPLKQSLDTPRNGHKVCREKKSLHEGTPQSDVVFEVRGGVWRRLLIDKDKDEFVVDPVKESSKEAFEKDDHARNSMMKSSQGKSLAHSVKWCMDLVRKMMLPDGYPSSVTGDYLEYTLWRMGQNIASQINGVLTTQALLYAVGLGKGAIPTAAAVNWVLKDGIGYLSKIMLAKYGRQFDVHPKGWRLVADLIENGSCALELLTPTYPHLFVYLGAAAGAGRSAAGLIQAATRSCFYAGFAAQRNFAEDHSSNLLSLQTKEDAAIIARKLNLGVSFGDVIRSQKEAEDLLKIYQNEQYVLVERQDTYQAILKGGATPHDLLKLMLQVCYLYQLQNGSWGSLAEGKLDFHAASPEEISHRLTIDNLDRLQEELASAGWTTSDGLVARPLPYRLLGIPQQKNEFST